MSINENIHPPSTSGDQRKIYMVFEITKRIRDTLEGLFQSVWVEGEVSNLREPTSGHRYFTLKDERSQISVVLFRGHRSEVSFGLENGLKIRVFGDISVYENRGQYQLVARQIEDVGRGSLQELFEKLKRKLYEEGLFDESRKRPLPLLPSKVGVVTSPTGAAIQDILHILNRRFPNLHIVIAPVKVQGDGAAEMIAKAIHFFNKSRFVDVVIVGRGGGSLEDLWAFNEEVVARAIAASEIPIISAVGHEIDLTICDLVADRRAPTPSAAAEIVVGRKDEFESMLREVERRFTRALEAHLHRLRSRLNTTARSYVFREPHHLLRHYRQKLVSDMGCMRHAIQSAFRDHQQHVDEIDIQLAQAMQTRLRSLKNRLVVASLSYMFRKPHHYLQQCRQTLGTDLELMTHHMKTVHQYYRQEISRLAGQLNSLSPPAVLNRGYSLTTTEEGWIVRNIDTLKLNDLLRTRFANGATDSRIIRMLPGEGDERKEEDDE